MGLIQYVFWGQSSLATLVAYAGVTWEFLSFKVSRVLSNKFFGIAGASGSTYLDLGGRYPLGAGFNAFAHYGVQQITSSDAGYSDYAIGVNKDWKSATWSAAIIGTDSTVNGIAVNGRRRDLGGRGLVLTVSKTFL